MGDAWLLNGDASETKGEYLWGVPQFSGTYYRFANALITSLCLLMTRLATLTTTRFPA